MKKVILVFLSLAGSAAYASCQDVYNPFSGEWEYQCTPEPSSPRQPDCHQEYDPMNNAWVTVCN